MPIRLTLCAWVYVVEDIKVNVGRKLRLEPNAGLPIFEGSLPKESYGYCHKCYKEAELGNGLCVKCWDSKGQKKVSANFN